MAAGRSVIRNDAAAKVTGRARYTQDLCLPHMLWAKYVRSTIAHGRVTEIDTAAAMAFPGVVAVFPFRDVSETKFSTANHLIASLIGVRLAPI